MEKLNLTMLERFLFKCAKTLRECAPAIDTPADRERKDMMSDLCDRWSRDVGEFIKWSVKDSTPPTDSTPCDHDIAHCCDDNEWLCSICGKSARFI